LMLGLSPVRHAIADTMTEVTIGYPDSPLNGPSVAAARPKPGERVVPIAGQAPIGSGSSPRFALFAEKTIAAGDLIKKFETLLDADVRPPFDNGGIWLVRPDGYVACSSRDADTVARYLDSFVRPSKP
jgi:hypothetical protein